MNELEDIPRDLVLPMDAAQELHMEPTSLEIMVSLVSIEEGQSQDIISIICIIYPDIHTSYVYIHNIYIYMSVNI